MLMIDADIIWNPKNVFRLLRHDLDIVCGALPLSPKQAHPVIPATSRTFKASSLQRC